MSIKSIILASTAAIILTACGGGSADVKEAATKAAEPVKEVMAKVDNKAKLAAILAAQPDKTKARYDARNPQATLEFFGVEPGMTVVEVLPGGGWYSKILIPYLGDEGHLVGVDYSLKMWPEFGGFANEEFMEKKKTWPATWVAGAGKWNPDIDGKISAFTFGDRNEAMDGQADAVLFIRALHNLSRFEDKGSYLSDAIADSHALLKTGGIVGVVQHQGPEGNDDEWAKGNNGYLKKSALIAQFEAAGFTLAGESAINENPKDVPSNEDMVWRLPPTLGTSKDNAELKAQMEAIGESNRMTLKFVKN